MSPSRTSRTSDSAQSYEVPTYVGGIYRPSRGRSFKGLLITAAGNIKIVGVDSPEIPVTFHVGPGLYPFGGNAIVADGTTCTISVVLF